MRRAAERAGPLRALQRATHAGPASASAGAGVLLRARGRDAGLRLRRARHHHQPAGQVRPPARHLP
ncbi:hypothetical protein PR202_gb23072 [Eleusine coracana subsp. coracana]|uniref:Uncharacterized protein n=1 Tax=Eleusine coracana subsp. coracana TaxID=191504 RepID=A0AAV5FHW4_ELECO|nr:hypothetical protein PR202_gb23072 [Eleusine coracana subsp. coracana]